MPSRLRRSLVLGAALAPLPPWVRAAAAADANPALAAAPLRVVYPRLLERPEHAFGFQVLSLALQRSGQAYDLKLGEPLISSRSARHLLETGEISVLDTGGVARLADQFDLVPFPIDYGLGGCRMLLGRHEVLKRLHGASRVEDLRPFVFGQGIDWNDSLILRNAGLHVEEGEFGNLVRMLQGGRFDLLPLGSDEADSILDRERMSAPDVNIDAGVGLLYPYLRVFFVSRGNTELRNALTRGLKAAHADGSLSALLARMPGIGPILTGQRALPRVLIGMSNPWMPTGLRGLSLDHIHPALRATLRRLWTDGQG